MQLTQQIKANIKNNTIHSYTLTIEWSYLTVDELQFLLKEQFGYTETVSHSKIVKAEQTAIKEWEKFAEDTDSISG